MAARGGWAAASAVGVLLVQASAATAEDWVYPEGRLNVFGTRYSLFVETGVYRAGSPATRRTFGDFEAGAASLLDLPVTVSLYRPRPARYLGPDLDLAWTHFEQDETKARFIAPTLGLHWERGHRVKPVLIVRGGPYFTRGHGVQAETLWGGNATVGLEVARAARLSVRYDWLPEGKGLDLSGLTLQLGLKVF